MRIINYADFTDFISGNAYALSTTYKDAIRNLPSNYWAVVYIEIPHGVSEDYEPERQETLAHGATQEEAESYFFKNHPGLHQNGYRWGSEIEHIENLTIGQVADNGWDL